MQLYARKLDNLLGHAGGAAQCVGSRATGTGLHGFNDTELLAAAGFPAGGGGDRERGAQRHIVAAAEKRARSRRAGRAGEQAAKVCVYDHIAGLIARCNAAGFHAAKLPAVHNLERTAGYAARRMQAEVATAHRLSIARGGAELLEGALAADLVLAARGRRRWRTELSKVHLTERSTVMWG